MELVRRCCDRRDIFDLELEADLRNGPVRRPLFRAETRFRGLPEWPDTEMLAAPDFLAPATWNVVGYPSPAIG